MRTRLLLVALVAALLPVLTAPSPATADSRPQLRVSAPRTAALGSTFTVTARLKNVSNTATVRLERRVGDEWTFFRRRFVRSTTKVHFRLPMSRLGRNDYRLVLHNFDDAGNRSRSAPHRITVRGTVAPQPKLRHWWTPLINGDHLAAQSLTVNVDLNKWIPATPRLTLQQQVAGGWRTLATAQGKKWDPSSPAWFVELAARVDGPGALRVVGHGPGWHLVRPLAPYVVDAGRMVIGSRSVLPANSGLVRRRWFDAAAGEELQLIPDVPTTVELRTPAGTTVPVGQDGHFGFRVPTAGRYTVDVAPASLPGTVWLLRPQYATVEADGPAVVLPATLHDRVRREVTYTGRVGDVLVGYVATTTGNCKAGPFLVGLLQATSVRGTLGCRTSEAMTVRTVRTKIIDVPTDGSPVEVAADFTGQPLALRFSTTSKADVTLTSQLNSRPAPRMWLDGFFQDPGSWTGNDTVTHPAGTHLVLIRPMLTLGEPLAGTVALTAAPLH